MQKKPHKISYVKKPFARRSRISFPFALAALGCCIASLGISARLQGNGDLDVAAWGVSSMIFSVISIVYAGTSFLEKEMNYILSKISLTISAALLVFWIGLLLVGLLG